MNEISDIIVTIDTREKNQKRINAVTLWAERHGAIVQSEKLDLCDYRIEGTFREKPVNIGIEAKSMQDLSTSYHDLYDKCARAYSLYDNVSVFIETNNYRFETEEDDFHCQIINPAVKDGSADIFPLAAYEGLCARLSREGVHVRGLRDEQHFPYAIAGLLIYTTQDIMPGLYINSDKSYPAQYLNILARISHIGVKRAQKLQQHFPNLHWLTSASEFSLQEILGKVEGKTLHAFLHNKELETAEWRMGYHSDGTKREEEKKPVPEVVVGQRKEEDRMNLRKQILTLLEKEPKTMVEMQAVFKDFQAGYVWDTIQRMHKEGLLEKQVIKGGLLFRRTPE